MCYRSVRRVNLSDHQIVDVLDDIPSDSDISGASDDSIADENYLPPGFLQQPDVETSEDDVEDEGGEDELPDIPDDIPDDLDNMPGPSGDDQRPLLRYNQPSKKRRVNGRR